MKNTIEIEVCDICGKEANGQYWRTTYVNGSPYEDDYCPHDLCKEHMEKWNLLCREQVCRELESSPSYERRAEMLQEFKEKLEVPK
ncbi:hypothetical protein ACVR7L_000039 [Listeria monocytogenes]